MLSTQLNCEQQDTTFLTMNEIIKFCSVFQKYLLHGLTRYSLSSQKLHIFAAIDVKDGMNCNLVYSVHLEIVGESTQIVHDAVVCIALHNPLDSFVTQSISSKLPRRSVSGDQLLME